MGTGRAKALLLNGSSGVGKSTALQELAMLLGARGIAHASIDLDELTLFWPRSADDPWGTRVAQMNLAAVSDTYRSVGVETAYARVNAWRNTSGIGRLAQSSIETTT